MPDHIVKVGDRTFVVTAEQAATPEAAKLLAMKAMGMSPETAASTGVEETIDLTPTEEDKIGMSLVKKAVPEQPSYFGRVQRRLQESGQSVLDVPSNVGALATGKGGMKEVMGLLKAAGAPVSPLTIPLEAAVEHAAQGTFGASQETAATAGDIGGLAMPLGVGILNKGEGLTTAGQMIARALGVGRPEIGRHEQAVLDFVRSRPEATMKPEVLSEATGALERLKNLINEQDVATLYHGTTKEQAVNILKEGFKPVHIQDEIRRAYEINGIPWDFRRSIPVDIRNFIESEPRQRIRMGEGGTISFAPTPEVAARWAGKGGEIFHEVDARLRTYLGVIKQGFRPKTADEMFAITGEKMAPYRQTGAPLILESKVKVSPFQAKTLRRFRDHVLQSMQEYGPGALESGIQVYHDMPQRDLANILNVKQLEDLEAAGKIIGGNTAVFALSQKSQAYSDMLMLGRRYGLNLPDIPTPNLEIGNNLNFTKKEVDLGFWRSFGTPSTQFAIINQTAAKAQWLMNLAEARVRSAIQLRNAEDAKYFKGLSKGEQEAIFKMMDGKPLSSVLNDPNATAEMKRVAAYVRQKLDADRVRVIGILKRDARVLAERELEDDFARAEKIAGHPLTEQQKTTAIEARVEKMVPSDWGLENYLPHILPGNYLIKVDGKVMGSASTKLQAEWEIRRLALAGSKPGSITVESKTFFDPEVLAGFRARTRRTLDSIARAGGFTNEEIEAAATGASMSARPKKVWWGPLLERKGAQGFSLELQYVMSVYNRGIERWEQLSQLSRDVAPVLKDLRASGYDALINDLESSMSRLWGYRSELSYQFDNSLQSIPGFGKFFAPYALERWAGRGKGGMVNVMLKFNPRYHFLNSIQTLTTLWPLIDSADLWSAYKMYASADGKALLKQFGVQGGRVAEFGKSIGIEETMNQGVAFLAMFKRGIKLGLTPTQAADYSILRGNLFSQFLGLTTDVPGKFRELEGTFINPQGLATMFQRFNVKQVELLMSLAADKNYPGAAKWLAVNFLMGGKKALTWGTGGYLGYKEYKDLENRYGKGFADFIHVGLPSLLGLDMSNSVSLLNIPFGETLQEKIGQMVLGVMGSTIATGYSAWMDEKGVEPEAAKRAYKALVERLPVARELDAAVRLIEGDYNLTDPKGRLQYKADARDLFVRLFGGTPLKKVKEPGKFHDDPYNLLAEAFLELRDKRDAVIDYAASRIAQPAMAGIPLPENVRAAIAKDVHQFNAYFPEFGISGTEIMKRARTRSTAAAHSAFQRLLESQRRKSVLGMAAQGVQGVPKIPIPGSGEGGQ